MFDPTASIHRRTFLGRFGLSLGGAAVAGLLARDGMAATASSTGGGLDSDQFLGAIHPLHHSPKAKAVIFLCLAGGPSHLETFDPKPMLARLDGQEMPASVTAGQPIAQLQGKKLVCLGPRATFSQHKECGTSVSDFFPMIGSMADRYAIVRSMVTDQINHDPAHTFMNCGTALSGRPSMGAWVTYGLGSQAENLPGFVVMTSKLGRNPQPIASRQWHSAFLPGQFQGVEFSTSGSPVHYVNNVPGVSSSHQRDLIDTVTALEQHRLASVADPEIVTRIKQYELAFRMQTSVPQLADLSSETPETLALYGAEPGKATVGTNCLMARRLVERGVRFVHLYHSEWDHHGGIDKYMREICPPTDRAATALLTDLERRGLLSETLVIIGGEFGRTPMGQGQGAEIGRDHHIKGFSMLLAGGGIRGGISHGATDDFGYHAVQDIVHVRDLHATMLHLLGIDHAKFTVAHQGLDSKLTGVEPAKPVKAILR
ncbi:MAG: DUF1501 domain-containing protein [Planctomycetota bacterium]|jgi:hypothetical protein|nr:MAG: DUF1501 domain-containing protein [Planctomycetota bacterium]